MIPKEPPPQKKVVPLQDALDNLQRQIDELKWLSIGQIDTNKLILRALLDLDLIDYEMLKSALDHLRGQYAEHILPEQMFVGMLKSFEASHGPSEQREPAPQLRLVQPDAPDQQE